jgi:cytochrome c oxidase subunit III
MARADVVDVSDLPVLGSGRQVPVYWGMWGLILIEATVFASLIASYFYLRMVAPEWPPAGVKPPELLLPTVNTVVLGASAYFMHRADTGIRKGDTGWLKLGLAISVVLAIAFLVIKVIEYSGVDYRWDSHAYGSIVWTLTGFHAFHVTAVILKTFVILALAARGYFTRDRNIGVVANGLYFNFVALVWLPIYAVLYYAPRLLD